MFSSWFRSCSRSTFSKKKSSIIDYGKIVATGSPQELMSRTGKTSLEDAFLALTGKTIREEEGNSRDRMRMFRRAHGRR